MDGITFDSQKEARRYGELKILERANRIFALKVHPVYSIELKGKKICDVELDFFYREARGKGLPYLTHYEDVKGRDLPMSRLKRKLIEAMYGIKVELT